jgi:hypothetical protein
VNGEIQVKECCKRVWLACAIDSEGSIQVWRQSSSAVSTRAYGIRVVVNNSDEAYVARVLEILSSMGISNWKTSRRTSKIGTKDVCEIKIAELNSIIKVLTEVSEYMVSKKAFCDNALALALLRRANRDEHGERAPWTDAECALAEEIRAKFMPASFAYGETLTSAPCAARAIPSEASGSAISTDEPLETRTTSSTSSNWSHECPAASCEVEDIARSSAKAESRDKKLCEDIARQA